MFASRVFSEVTIGGIKIKIRKLSGRQLNEAAEIVATRTTRKMAELGAETLKAIQAQHLENERNKTPEQKEAERKALEEKAKTSGAYDSYDVDYTLSAGVVSWSDASPVNDASLGDLVASARKALFEAIIDHTIKTEESPKG